MASHRELSVKRGLKAEVGEIRTGSYRPSEQAKGWVCGGGGSTHSKQVKNSIIKSV